VIVLQVFTSFKKPSDLLLRLFYAVIEQKGRGTNPRPAYTVTQVKACHHVRCNQFYAARPRLQVRPDQVRQAVPPTSFLNAKQRKVDQVAGGKNERQTTF